MSKIRHSLSVSRSTCASLLTLVCVLCLSPTKGRAQAKVDLKPRQFAAVAHNAEDRQFLLFGGTYGGTPFSDTWLLGAAGWKKLAPAVHPQARVTAVSAYDSVRDEYVLFGGRVKNVRGGLCSQGAVPKGLATQYFCSDTWVFRANNWTLKRPAHSPSARELHAMAFDAPTRQVVLFGGVSTAGAAPLADTWVWDGATWRQVATAHHPPARFGHAMAYDPVRQQVVMFGGHGGSKILNDTWLWNGRDWLPAVTQRTAPEARTGSGLDYNASAGKMVLYSGMVWNGVRVGTPSADAWAWDGSQWKKMAATSFQVLTDFTQITPNLAKNAIVTSGTPSMVWVAR